MSDVTEELEEAEEETGRACFDIHNGRKMVRIKALKDCWALQEEMLIKDPKTKISALKWMNKKYFTDLASAAGKIFDLRLKNSEVTTLLELSEAAKQIRMEIRYEFGLGGCACHE